jgi:hypothetical protein
MTTRRGRRWLLSVYLYFRSWWSSRSRSRSKGEVKGQVGWAVDRRVPSLCRSSVEYQEPEREERRRESAHQRRADRGETSASSPCRRGGLIAPSSIHTHTLRLAGAAASSGWIEAGAVGCHPELQSERCCVAILSVKWVEKRFSGWGVGWLGGGKVKVYHVSALLIGDPGRPTRHRFLSLLVVGLLWERSQVRRRCRYRSQPGAHSLLESLPPPFIAVAYTHLSIVPSVYI